MGSPVFSGGVAIILVECNFSLFSSGNKKGEKVYSDLYSHQDLITVRILFKGAVFK